MEWIKYSLVYTADSIRKFDSKSNRTADLIQDSIRTQKNDSQVPSPMIFRWYIKNFSLASHFKCFYSVSVRLLYFTTLNSI